MPQKDLDRYVKPEDVLVQELDGEAVLLNLANELYFGLDEVGYRMYELMTTSKSLDNALNQLIQEYDVDAEKIKQDFDKLFNDLVASSLIAKVDG